MSDVVPPRLTVGVWIQLMPGSLADEGIGRLLSFFIEGAAGQGTRFVIACPSWYRKDLDDFVGTLSVDSRQAISVLSARKNPSVFLKFNRKGNGEKNGFEKWGDWIRGTKAKVKTPILRWIAGQSLVVLALTALLLSPILVPAFALIVLYLALQLVRSFLVDSENPVMSGLRQQVKGAVRFYLQWFRGLINQLHEHAIVAEYDALASVAGRRNDVATWYVPNPSWFRAAAIGKPLVVAFPDFVIEDYPLGFLDWTEFAVQAKKNIGTLLKSADRVICYRQHVSEKHVQKLFNFAADRISVVPHAPVSLHHYVKWLERESDSRKLAGDLLRQHFAKKYIEDVSRFEFQARYLPDFAIEDSRFLLLSSRQRPYKNIARVVEAVEMLIRQRKFDIKLIVTGAFTAELDEYVREKRLMYDVISLHHVPPDLHAYLFYLAEAAIHPSFFEGGFPFTFSEALSVGKPVLLASMPYVTEVIDENSDGDFLFDPYSVDDIADKIQHAVRNRDSLLTRQKQILAGMKSRTWESVAEEYLNVMRDAAGLSECTKPGLSLSAAADTPKSLSTRS